MSPILYGVIAAAFLFAAAIAANIHRAGPRSRRSQGPRSQRPR